MTLQPVQRNGERSQDLDLILTDSFPSTWDILCNTCWRWDKGKFHQGDLTWTLSNPCRLAISTNGASTDQAFIPFSINLRMRNGTQPLRSWPIWSSVGEDWMKILSLRYENEPQRVQWKRYCNVNFSASKKFWKQTKWTGSISLGFGYGERDGQQNSTFGLQFQSPSKGTANLPPWCRGTNGNVSAPNYKSI